MKLTQKAKLLTKNFRPLLRRNLIFQALSILMVFQIYFIFSLFILLFFIMEVSIWLAATVITNRYCTSVLTKFRQLFLSFQKMWGYPTSPISWFINFNNLPQLLDYEKSIDSTLLRPLSIKHSRVVFLFIFTWTYDFH